MGAKSSRAKQPTQCSSGKCHLSFKTGNGADCGTFCAQHCSEWMHTWIENLPIAFQLNVGNTKIADAAVASYLFEWYFPGDFGGAPISLIPTETGWAFTNWSSLPSSPEIREKKEPYHVIIKRALWPSFASSPKLAKSPANFALPLAQREKTPYYLDESDAIASSICTLLQRPTSGALIIHVRLTLPADVDAQQVIQAADQRRLRMVPTNPVDSSFRDYNFWNASSVEYFEDPLDVGILHAILPPITTFVIKPAR